MLTSVLYDKTQWETPDRFNPEHFLNAEGKFVKREALLPFSAGKLAQPWSDPESDLPTVSNLLMCFYIPGKRVCLGESLAKMELFLFLVGLLQKFSFSVADKEKLSVEGITGSVRTPHPFEVYAKARWSSNSLPCHFF